jgi:hypothetical protein
MIYFVIEKLISFLPLSMPITGAGATHDHVVDRIIIPAHKEILLLVVAQFGVVVAQFGVVVAQSGLWWLS